MTDRGGVTACPKAWSSGDVRVADQWMPLIYDEIALSLSTMGRDRRFAAARLKDQLQNSA